MASEPKTTVPAVTPELPSLAWRAVLAALGRLPQAGMSRSLGRLADVPIPERMRRTVLGIFAKGFRIDVGEAERPLEDYETLNAFFVRRLRAGARVWPDDPDVIASPVDGIVGQLGEVHRGRLIQAKGRTYSAAELLGDEGAAARLEGGSFLTIYLAPRHYHRIHAPATAVIERARHVPGALLPVNGPAVDHVEDLFARNERVVCHLRRDEASLVVVAIGAYNVGRISTAFDPAWGGGNDRNWVTNRTVDLPAERTYEPPLDIARGDEIMAFHLGSTIVLLLEPRLFRLEPGLRQGAEVRLGEGIAQPVL
jgi:phosphatidylserine decarboxylase